MAASGKDISPNNCEYLIMKPLQNTWGKLRDAYANRYQPEGVRVLVFFYWRTLIVLSALLIVASVTYGFLQLVSEPSTESGTSVVGNTAPPLDKGKLEATLKSFEDRQAEYENLKNNPPRVADPS